MHKTTLNLLVKTLKLWLWSTFHLRWYLPNTLEITSEELEVLIETENPPFLLDLRDKKEFDGTGKYKHEKLGHIPSSYLIPFFQLPSRIDEIPLDREIVTVCPGGGASLVAVDVLINSGFDRTKVRSLKSGIKGWQKKGYKLTIKETNQFENTYEENVQTKENFIQTHQSRNEIAMINISVSLDTRGLHCPEPILKLKEFIKELDIDQIFEVLADDPGSYSDIPVWVIHSGQELVLGEKLGKKMFRFVIKRKI